MDDGDCLFYCCGKCRGLFEDLDDLTEHKRRTCDGKTAGSDCALFACERKQHQGHDLHKNTQVVKATPVKRRKGLSHDEEVEEAPSHKKKKENPPKKAIEKKEHVKSSMQDVTTGSTTLPDSPAGRRSSGRVRNMPSKYKDFAHQLKIKEEPEDDGFTDAGMDKSSKEGKTVKSAADRLAPDDLIKSAQIESCGKEGTAADICSIDPVGSPPKAQNSAEAPDDLDLEGASGARDEGVLESSQESAQLEQSFEENVESSPQKNMELDSVAKTALDGEYERSETRTRRIKVEKVKDEPEDLIREIFDGELDVKRPSVFTKEQKDVLVEKYKDYYKLAEIKVKIEEQNDSEQAEENAPETEAQLENKNDELSDNGEVDGEKDSTEKENKKSRRKPVNKRAAKKNKGKSAVDAIKPRWLYHCPVCIYTTKHVGFFEHHMTRAHDNGKLWICDKCEYTHANKGVMRLHRNAHIKPFMCEYCSHKFSTGIDLKKHRYTHTGETPYKCKQCDWAGRQKKALIEHMRKHTGETLKCVAHGCGFETTYRWALEQHRRSKHEEGKRFQCAECPYATSDSGSFSKHKKYHQGVKDYRCGQCSYKGVTKNDVIKHMRIHTHEKIYFCDRCQYSSCHSSAFKAHMMSHLGLKSWQCKICSFTATTRAKVIRHLESRHGTQDKSNAVNLPKKLQLNFEDFKVPQDARSQANIVYEVIEAVEGSTDETGAIVMEGEEGEMSVVTHVDAEEFQGLAGLAAASEAAAAQEQQTVTQIIVQTVDADGNPTDEQQHIELTGLPAGGGMVSLPGGVVHLPPGVMDLQPGQVVTTTGEDGSNVTYLQGAWPPAGAESVVQEEGEEGVVQEEAVVQEEGVVETYIIEEPVAQMS